MLRRLRLFTFMLLMACSSVLRTTPCAAAVAAPFAPDGVQQVFTTDAQTNAKTYAVGDLHGDFQAFLQILLDLRLVDAKLDWTGGANRLVLMGDLFAGADDSRMIVDLIMKLEIQAAEADGGVHCLLGNHDLRVASGDLGSLSEKEKRRFTEFPIDGFLYPTPEAAIKFSKYGSWLAKQNQAIIVNRILFSHAGLDPRAMRGVSLSDLNTNIRSWIRSWLAQPLQRWRWVVGLGEPQFTDMSGGSWYRGYKLNEESLKELPTLKMYKSFLNLLGADRMVIGHAPTPDAMPILSHPLYASLLTMIDTSISDRKRGSLSAVEFDAEGEARALKFEFRESSKTARKLVIKNLKNKCVRLFSAPGRSQ